MPTSATEEIQMRLTRLNYFALFLFTCLLTSCAKPTQSHSVVTESEALGLAKAEFLKTGLHLNEYQISVETDSTGRRWLVWFDKNGSYLMPGGKHMVTVEKATGKAAFMLGE